MKEKDVEETLKLAFTKIEPYINFEQGSTVARVQLTEHKNPVFYNRQPDSDSRYAHRERKVGVLYLAISPELALAETFQGDQHSSVSVREIQDRSLHHLKVTRDLRLADVGRLSAFLGFKPRDLLAAKGQGSEGYRVTQLISTLCMEHSHEIDGLIYSSSVYAPTGTSAGCNIALFEGRGSQVEPVVAMPLMEAVLPNGETAIEFLETLSLSVE